MVRPAAVKLLHCLEPRIPQAQGFRLAGGPGYLCCVRFAHLPGASCQARYDSQKWLIAGVQTESCTLVRCCQSLIAQRVICVAAPDPRFST